MRRLSGDAAALVLREMLTLGTPARRSDIAERVDVHRGTVARGFDELEAEGILVADVEAGRRHGRTPVYRVDRLRLAQVQNDFIAWLHGGPGTFSD